MTKKPFILYQVSQCAYIEMVLMSVGNIENVEWWHLIFFQNNTRAKGVNSFPKIIKPNWVIGMEILMELTLSKWLVKKLVYYVSEI